MLSKGVYNIGVIMIDFKQTKQLFCLSSLFYSSLCYSSLFSVSFLPSELGLVLIISRLYIYICIYNVKINGSASVHKMNRTQGR